jgi:hypothetical protein
MLPLMLLRTKPLRSLSSFRRLRLDRCQTPGSLMLAPGAPHLQQPPVYCAAPLSTALIRLKN